MVLLINSLDSQDKITFAQYQKKQTLPFLKWFEL